MADRFLTLEFWLAQAAFSMPLILTMVVGLVICYRQRRRRPRVSKLIGRALVAELLWLVVGIPMITWAHALYQSNNPFVVNGQVTSILRMILFSLPGSIVNAAIWGTVLWAVLQVDDVREESSRV